MADIHHAPCHLYPPDDRTKGARSTFCLPGTHEPICIMCGDGFPCPESGDTFLRQEINGPGAYDGMPGQVYQDDPAPAADGGSLSHSGAMKLLPPKTPAHFAYWRTAVQGTKKVWDLGQVIHTSVLGVGSEVKILEYDSWRTNAVKEAAATARALGQVPMLAKEVEIVPSMVEVLRNHPKAGPLLDMSRGTAERSFFWRHPRTRRWCRSRPDYCPDSGGRRFVLVDYKTVESADEDAFGKSVANFGYHVQRAMAVSAVRNLGLHPDPEFAFVVQERTPPYLVAVHFLPYAAVVLGERKFDQAATLFDQCTTAGSWPGFGGANCEPLLTVLPRWATYGEEDLP